MEKPRRSRTFAARALAGRAPWEVDDHATRPSADRVLLFFDLPASEVNSNSLPLMGGKSGSSYHRKGWLIVIRGTNEWQGKNRVQAVINDRSVQWPSKSDRL